MPKHHIQIGKLSLESSKDFEWDDILEIAKDIKKFAKWDPENKKWIANWRIITNLSTVKRVISRIRKIDPSYSSELESAINRIINQIPKFHASSESILLLSLDADPYELIEKLNVNRKNAEIVFRKVNLEEFNGLKVPYISIPKEVARNERDRLLNVFPQMLREIFESIDKDLLEERVRVYPISPRKILIDLGRIKNKELEEELIKLGEIKLFIEDASGELKEKVYKLHKRIVSEKGYIKIILPSYAIGVVEGILNRYDLEVDIDYGIILKEIETIRSKVTLMRHQLEAFNAWKQMGNRGTIVIPTGGGKTFVALEAIADLKLPTLILVPNKWLLKQWASRIYTYLGVPKGMIGILGGGERKIREITVSTYQSAYKYVEDITDKFALAIFDEAHHVPAKTFKNIALYLRAIYRMALSATPKRRDRNEKLLFKLVGNIVYQISLRELVEEGILAPLVVRKIYVRLPASLSAKYRQYERLLNRARTEFEKRRYLNKLIEIARDNPEKIKVIREIIERHRNKKNFVFAGSIKFAELIEKEIKSITPTALLTSKTKKTTEDKIVNSFHSGIIRCLVLVKKGEEGVDIGDASVAIIAGGSKQERELIQRVGRILRGRKDKLAWLYEIVTKNTVDEMLSKSRNIKKLVSEIEDLVKEKYGLKAFDIQYY